MNGNTKLIVKVLIGAAAAAFVYYWLNKQGYLQQWFGGGAAPAPQPPQPTQPVAGAPAATASAPAPAAASPAPTVTPAYSQAIQLMKQAAGTNTLNFDQWSYYWQHGTPFAGAPLGFGVDGSISPTFFGQIVQLGGGNNQVGISAEQFVGWLLQAQQKGLSGMSWGNAPRPYGWVN